MICMELQEKRTYSTKHFDNGDGTFRLDTNLGHVHYKDVDGNLVDSDLTPVDMGTYWEMTKHNYHLRVAKDFAAPRLMQYTNKFEGANHTILYEPFAIAWYKASTNDVQIFRNQQSVQAVYNAEKNSFYYTNAFGAGIDFEITIGRSGFTKEIVVPNKPASLPNSPGVGYRMVALFKYGGTAAKVYDKTQQLWDNSSNFESQDGYEIAESDGLHRSFIQPAYATDETGSKLPLKVIFRQHNSQLWQIKEIPLAAMTNAVYPVRFDTTTDYGYNATNSKECAQDGVATYAGAHDATTSTVYTLSSGIQNFLHNSKITTYYVRRADLQFDTSGIPDGDTVTAAVLTMYGNNSGGGNVNADTVVALNNTDNANLASTLEAEDMDDFGTTSIGSTALSAYTNAGANVDLTLTSYTAINKTGTTRIGLRLQKDIDNTEPTGTNVLRIDTSKACKLTITYAATATFTPRVSFIMQYN